MMHYIELLFCINFRFNLLASMHYWSSAFLSSTAGWFFCSLTNHECNNAMVDNVKITTKAFSLRFFPHIMRFSIAFFLLNSISFEIVAALILKLIRLEENANAFINIPKNLAVCRDNNGIYESIKAFIIWN